MYRLKEESIHTMEIEKSKFITYLNRVFSEQEAKDYIASIQKLHPNATHHCYAFITGTHNEIVRSNDNGEPSGTAGVPMLECLKKKQMQDIVAVTVRYFGGIKLGAGGLIRAYSKSVSLALINAPLTIKKEVSRYSLHFSYDLIAKIDHFFRQNNITPLCKIYENDVQYVYQSDQDLSAAISELTSGKYIPIFQLKETIEMDVV